MLNELCSEVEDLLENGLQTFVWALLSRCMVTSTSVEKTFAPMTQFTFEPGPRVSLPLLQAKHCNTIFVEGVQQWWETFYQRRRRTEDFGSQQHTFASGSGTNAWNLYAKGPAGNPDIVFDKQVVLDIGSDKRADFMVLGSEETKVSASVTAMPLNGAQASKFLRSFLPS